MKKSLLALAVLGAFAGAASAQSSVTLFGIVDANAQYIKNGDVKMKKMGTDGIASSRLGFRGVEDLGGGLKASFWLEHRFNPDAGTINASGKMWHGRSTVSLLGNFGEVRLGRDLVPTFQGFADYDVFGTNGLADAGKFNSVLGSGAATGTRADNGISYLTPTLGGFYGRLTVAAGEGVPGNKYIGGRVGYAAGPLDVSGSYGTTEDAAGEKYKKANLGASYDFGVVKVAGYASQAKYFDQKLNIYQIGVQAPVGPGTIKASFIRADAKGTTTTGASVNANDANQVAVGYVYDLSKRTALYTTLARVKNKGAATFAVSTPPAMTAGAKSSGAEVGIRHAF